jgi:hypothetical protein
MPDVLPGGLESLDASVGHESTTLQHGAEPPVRQKESVAHMTFGGLAFVVAVSKERGKVTLRLQCNLCVLTAFHQLCVQVPSCLLIHLGYKFCYLRCRVL